MDSAPCPKGNNLGAILEQSCNNWVTRQLGRLPFCNNTDPIALDVSQLRLAVSGQYGDVLSRAIVALDFPSGASTGGEALTLPCGRQ